MEITLEQLLASRDARQQTQQELLQLHSGMTLVCLTVIMPGRIKRNRHSLVVAKAATEALKASPLYQEGTPFIARDLATGYEAYLLTPLQPTEAKRQACEIEETHPLGRLFDLDVIGSDGIPLSRKAIGYAPRRCLLCDNEVRYCMRNRTHTQEEIHARIQELVEGYRPKNNHSPCTTSTKSARCPCR